MTKVCMEKAFSYNFFGVVADRMHRDTGSVSSIEKMMRFQESPSFFNASCFIASDISSNYEDCEWRMIHCRDNDFFFLHPDTDARYEVKSTTNGKLYSFDPVTFGIVVSLSAYVCMLYHYHSKGESSLGIRYANDGKKLKRFFDSLVSELTEGGLDDNTNTEQKTNISIMLESVNACLGGMNY